MNHASRLTLNSQQEVQAFVTSIFLSLFYCLSRVQYVSLEPVLNCFGLLFTWKLRYPCQVYWVWPGRWTWNLWMHVSETVKCWQCHPGQSIMKYIYLAIDRPKMIGKLLLTLMAAKFMSHHVRVGFFSPITLWRQGRHR